MGPARMRMDVRVDNWTEGQHQKAACGCLRAAPHERAVAGGQQESSLHPPISWAALSGLTSKSHCLIGQLGSGA